MKLRNKHGEVIDHVRHEGIRDDVVVVIGHGVTAELDRPLSQSIAEHLSAQGWPCIRISWTGNGNSEGKFEDSCVSKEVDDLQAIIDQVKGAKQFVYIGHSMGGAVGAMTAAKDDRIDVLVSLAGMVHTKEFYDAEFGNQVAGESFMWDEERCPLSTTYATDLQAIGSTTFAAKDVRKPWLFLHGDADDLVPPHHSENLYNTLKGKKKYVLYEGADHVFEGGDYYQQMAIEIDLWLSKHIKKK